MDWETLKKNIYYEDGSWRDIYVFDADIDDWKQWVELVNNNYKIDFWNPLTEENNDKIDLNPVLDYWSKKSYRGFSAGIFLDDIQLKCHFFSSKEIENDFVPNEFKTIEDHQKLINYLQAVSSCLNKEVVITAENCRDIIHLKVNGNETEIFK